jgi:tripartite-type tricarboxylate transporter receptor subunit TctC
MCRAHYVLGVDITHVPYRGTAPAMQDLIGGGSITSVKSSTPGQPQIDGTVKGPRS